MRLHAVIALLGLAVTGVARESKQVHLSLTQSDDSMAVQWVSKKLASSQPPTVKYGTSPDALGAEVQGDSREFKKDTLRRWYTHVGIMTNLSVNTRYYYTVSDAEGLSEVFSFLNKRTKKDDEPYKHVILGDMGASYAFAICRNCTGSSYTCDKATCAPNTTAGLVSEQDADMMLHVGDFAYNLNTLDGIVGDHFFANIEQFAANVPYQVSIGNHENSDGALAHFIERFRSQPSNAVPATVTTSNGPGATNTLYFSWNHQLVHYVSVSTEFWFTTYNGINATDFLKWLEADLQHANLPENRAKFPWIVVEGHRSMYCTSNDGDCTGQTQTLRDAFEGLLYKYGVDLFINGHEHDYERTWPMYQSEFEASYVNPNATVFIVNGGAGNSEIHDPFTVPQPNWSAFRSNAFSYGRMYVYNATHINWQQVQTDPYDGFPLSDYGKVIDDWWLVQHKHGAFNPSHAPTIPKGRCAHGECNSHDHWAPMLGLEDGSGRTTVELIQAFRAEHGDDAWRAKLDKLLQKVNGANTERLAAWEDVRENGNSDNAWAYTSHDSQGQFMWKHGGQ